MSATTDTGAEAQNDTDELPANWTETATGEVARFERDDGAVVRVRTDFAIRSAAEFNSATHSDASGTVRVLFDAGDDERPETIHEGGTEADARAAALEYINEEVR